jgi:hypothetical protein
MLGIACGAQKAPDAKSGTNESSGEAASSGGDTAESAAPAGSEATASDESKPAAGSDKAKFDPVALCNGMCDAIAKKCGEAKEKVCRATCDDKYDVVPDECAEKTKEAFDCGRKAEDLLCSSFVPPSCSQNFDALAACATLGRDERQKDYKAPVPSGWKRIEDKKAGFAVWMPPGAKSADEPDGHAWTVTDTDGVEYRALVFRAPAGNNADAVLKTAAGTFLKDCTKGLKLRGRWDKGDEIGIAFGGKCKDGTGWRGVMRMTKGTIYALGLRGKTDKDGAHDGFTYSFEYLNAK